MKETYINDLLHAGEGTEVKLLCWIGGKRCHGGVIFLDLCDSTGIVQAVILKGKITPECFLLAKQVSIEAAVSVRGVLAFPNPECTEIVVSDIALVGGITKGFSPSPRGRIDIFDERLTPHLLENRHIYLRNPKVMAILQFRDLMLHHIRGWFYDNHFTCIDAPILTAVPLYDDESALSMNINSQKVFLTQCVGYYLEAAAHAFERVFNIGPSFRGEESRSKRHLMEYWHIKAEMAWANLDDIMGVVEGIVGYIAKKCQAEAGRMMAVLGTTLCLDGLKAPFPRISYEDSIGILDKKGMSMTFGKSLGSEEEAELSKLFPGSPFWVTGIPRSIEPFPYVIDPKDTRITRVADLIASNGYGELLGTAEKISDLAMLDECMQDKNKSGDSRFEFVRDVHQVGCVPHAAFGMGVERMIRWMLNIPHVRDAIPFPRIFRRSVSP